MEPVVLDVLPAYALRVLPGMLLILTTFALLPRKTDAIRIMLLILAFLLLRDAMTPEGFWRFGTSPGPLVWIRFAENGALLVTLGGLSLFATLLMLFACQGMNRRIRWFGRKPALSVAAGVSGALAVAAPLLIAYAYVPIEERGGLFPASLLPHLLFLALSGNLLEEVLFRGYLQGYFEERGGPLRAAVLSGLSFAAGHVFLSATVTDLGVPVLVFTLCEGIVCGLVRMRHGVAASALTHGLAIFLLASGRV